MKIYNADSIMKNVISDGFNCDKEDLNLIMSSKEEFVTVLESIIQDPVELLEERSEEISESVSIAALLSGALMKNRNVSPITEFIDMYYDLLEPAEEYLSSIIADVAGTDYECLVEKLEAGEGSEHLKMECLDALSIIGLKHPSTRAAIISYLGDLLSGGTLNPHLNGFVVIALESLVAKEKKNAVMEAYIKGTVDEQIIKKDEFIELIKEETLEDNYHRLYYNPEEILSEKGIQSLIKRESGYDDESLRELIAEELWGSYLNAGRNDPCPCGSDKKFKKCCLPYVRSFKNSETAVDTLRYLIDQEIEDRLENANLEKELDASYRNISNSDSADRDFLLDYAVHDLDREGNGSMLNEFSEKESIKLEPDETELIKSWAGESYSLLRVKGIRRGLGVVAEDLFFGGGKEEFIVSPSISVRVSNQKFIFFRPYHVRGIILVSGPLLRLSDIPAKSLIKAILELYKGNAPDDNAIEKVINGNFQGGKDFRDFMKKRSLEVMDSAFEIHDMVKRTVHVTAEGDELSPTRSIVYVRDPESAVKTLLSDDDFDHSLEHNEDKDMLVWFGSDLQADIEPDDASGSDGAIREVIEDSAQDKDGESRGIRGTIFLMNNAMGIECMSKRRHDALIQRIKNLLGDNIDEVKDLNINPFG